MNQVIEVFTEKCGYIVMQEGIMNIHKFYKPNPAQPTYNNI